jgi:HAD superfamily phosphatase (TIGR01668 family)
MKLFQPILMYNSVQDINFDDLNRYNIKGIVLDIDNTLIDYKETLSDAVKNWVYEAKKRGYKLCILTNTSKEKKAQKVSNILGLEYIKLAKKPTRGGYRKAIKLLGFKAEEIAMVGDQLLTDVLGANIMKMVSIYVNPINQKEVWYTKFKRPIEKWLLKSFNL